MKSNHVCLNRWLMTAIVVFVGLGSISKVGAQEK
jgi:hypothetical protein